MKKHIPFISFIIVITFLLSNCASPIKLANSWKSKEFSKTKEKKILVIARSKDMALRKSYEQSVAKELKNKNINALEGTVAFPKLDVNQNRSKEEINTIVSELKEQGFQGVLLMSLKDTKTIVKWPQNLKTSSSYQGNYKRFKIGFTDFYDMSSTEYITSNLRPRPNNDKPKISQPLKSTTYLLEALLYDLELGEYQQLVGGFQVSAKDPESANQVLTNFTKILGKRFR